MSSTRLINNPTEYKIQNIRKKKIDNYLNFREKLHHPNSKFPEFGINMGNMPADVLSRNFADIDSFLKGTYFNNLENSRDSINVNLKDMDTVAFFERPKVFMPDDLVIDKNRPVIFRR